MIAQASCTDCTTRWQKAVRAELDPSTQSLVTTIPSDPLMAPECSLHGGDLSQQRAHCLSDVSF